MIPSIPGAEIADDVMDLSAIDMPGPSRKSFMIMIYLFAMTLRGRYLQQIVPGNFNGRIMAELCQISVQWHAVNHVIIIRIRIWELPQFCSAKFLLFVAYTTDTTPVLFSPVHSPISSSITPSSTSKYCAKVFRQQPGSSISMPSARRPVRENPIAIR